MGKYFGTDGVRGEANKELTPELAFKLGRYGGYVLSQHETDDRRPRVLVGRDHTNLWSVIRKCTDRWFAICGNRSVSTRRHLNAGCGLSTRVQKLVLE